MKEIRAEKYRIFERIKQVRDDGSEFWSARDLAVVLGYTQWKSHK